MNHLDRTTQRVIFRGRVQGVGFRWTVMNIANRFAVAGTVRNLNDGTVEVIVQATPQEADRFLNEILFEFRENITTHGAEDVFADQTFSGFSIAY